MALKASNYDPAIKAGAVMDADIDYDDSVNTDDIEDLAVTAGKLAATLDLSSKTVILPTNSVTATNIIAPKLSVIQQNVAFDAFTDGGATVGIFDLTPTIPNKALFVQAVVTDVTGFAGDTSAVLTIGDGTDVDRYNTGTIDVFSTVDAIAAGAPSGTAVHTAEETVTLTITTAADFSSVSAGAVKITLFYYEV